MDTTRVTLTYRRSNASFGSTSLRLHRALHASPRADRSQFTEGGVAVDRVVKADRHATAFEHAVTKKLPGTILSVM
jgi:hypothetical protein